jgi:hypothetical protein
VTNAWSSKREIHRANGVAKKAFYLAKGLERQNSAFCCSRLFCNYTCALQRSESGSVRGFARLCNGETGERGAVKPRASHNVALGLWSGMC